jgi:sterol 24-C-methyltransferase
VPRSVREEQVAPLAREYRGFHGEARGASPALRKKRYMEMVNRYYDLVTDFYEFGWGQSFHFAPRLKGESFAASLTRHELFLSRAIGLRPGMRVLDVGCGVGGPLRAIARESGAHIVGLNNNAYQLQKCKAYNRAAGLGDRTETLEGDFMQIPAEPASFDAVYQIEATAHAPDKLGVYSEIFRVLKPGGLFGGYEWCMTSEFDVANPKHQRVKAGIEEGAGLPEIASPVEVLGALRAAGFEVIESRDLAAESHPDTPWYRALEGRDLSLRSLPRTSIGSRATALVLRILEPLGLVPKGTAEIQTFLSLGADSLVAGGRMGVFTPMFYFKARKP